MKKVFVHFFLFIIFFLIHNLTWKFVQRFAMLLESLMYKNWENLYVKFRFMQTFPTKAPLILWDAEIPASLKGLKQSPRYGYAYLYQHFL